MLLVGTNNSGSSSFYAINPKDGTNQGGPITGLPGDVMGMAVVEYPARAFFLTSAPDPSPNLYGLNLGPPGTPVLSGATMPGGNPRSIGEGSTIAPVMRNSRLYFADVDGDVQGYNILNGAIHAFCPTGDGQVKGFLWPDRRNNNLYFSSDTKVQGFRDDGTTFGQLSWSPITSSTHLSISSPSAVLQKPGTDYLYVGNDQGQLVQIDLSSGTPVITPLQLEQGGQIGAPSLDGQFDLLVVGSVTGTIYAVRIPYSF
jgi:hypothetical protein